MIDQEEMAKDVRALFGTPQGRNVLQQILEYAGVYEAPGHLSSDQLWQQQGARGLALDLATMAGVLPEIPGSAGLREPDRADTALEGSVPPEGEAAGEEAIA